MPIACAHLRCAIHRNPSQSVFNTAHINFLRYNRATTHIDIRVSSKHVADLVGLPSF